MNLISTVIKLLVDAESGCPQIRVYPDLYEMYEDNFNQEIIDQCCNYAVLKEHNLEILFPTIEDFLLFKDVLEDVEPYQFLAECKIKNMTLEYIDKNSKTHTHKLSKADVTDLLKISRKMSTECLFSTELSYLAESNSFTSSDEVYEAKKSFIDFVYEIVLKFFE